MRANTVVSIIGLGLSTIACGAMPVDGAGGAAGMGGSAGAGPSCPSTCEAARAVLPQRGGDWACQSTALCDRVSFTSPPSFSITPPYTLVTPDEARCALEALRDGREGLIEWGVASKGGPGVDISWRVYVRAGRVALTKATSNSDLVTNTSFGVNTLQSPAYFSDCLTKSDADAIYECFDKATGVTCR